MGVDGSMLFMFFSNEREDVRLEIFKIQFLNVSIFMVQDEVYEYDAIYSWLIY